MTRLAPPFVKRRTRPYGGASVAFPKVGDFQAFIRRRDKVCQLCGLTCGQLDVAHLLFKVQMGGRKNVSVNQPWNACLLGRRCHEAQEHSKRITAWLVARLLSRFKYVLPDEACARLERYAAGPLPEPVPALFADDDERDAFTPGLTATNGRAG